MTRDNWAEAFKRMHENGDDQLLDEQSDNAMNVNVLGKIIVHNSRTCTVPSNQKTYIGRPTVLGNPFVLKSENMRGEVIKKYDAWLRDKIQDSDSPEYKFMSMLVQRYKSGDTINLVCWCSPKPCHGDVIKQIVEEMAHRV